MLNPDAPTDPLNDHDYCSPASKTINNTSTTTSNSRAKRPRQNKSVTDKSEWIMGDDQIDSVLSEHLEDEEPTIRKRQHSSRDSDQAFDDALSSDYSSSNAESDDDSEYNSEDDPDRLWCICQKPHEGKFMICCDICKDWFHGHCVGVTKLMGDRFEKEGKEWFCMECSDKLRAGIPRSAIPTKLVKKKEKRKKTSATTPQPGKRGRGRPRKSETLSRETVTRSSQRNLRRSLDSKLGIDNGRIKRNLSRTDVRTESFHDFKDNQRLKVLIKERRKEFFYKRQLAEQQKAAKRNELGLGRRQLTGNLSESLDSLATTTNTPNMSNLPINIKSDHAKERSKLVLQINTKKEPGSDQGNPRIVTAIVRSPKKKSHSESGAPALNDLFTADPIQISKKIKIQELPSPTIGDTSGPSSSDRKHSISGTSIKSEKHTSPSDQAGDAGTPKRKRKDSDNISNGSTGGSKHISQKIKESLEARSKQIKDLEVTTGKIETLATEIEAQLNECFKEGTHKYMNKFRSLIFNLRDPKNQCLVTNVLSGEITPARLVRMSPDEMASNELAKWRERENKHSIELIKRDAQLAAQQVIVKKTHKGEEVISAPSLNDPDDPSVEVSNQEPPTTPTKHSSKEPTSDINLSNSVSPTTTITKNPVPKRAVANASPEPQEDSVASIEPTLALDATIDDKSQTSDFKSTKEPENPIEVKQEEDRCLNETEQQDQPKRFRVTIDTKLDPANLSRLKEPLIKPIEQFSAESDENNSMTLTGETANSNDGSDYDCDIPPGLEDVESLMMTTSDEPGWLGTITMPEIAKFRAQAKSVDGDISFLKHAISPELTVCGRIAPDQVQGYIKKLRSTTKNQIILVQLFPLEPKDKYDFDTFFDYLYSRNRYGVIQTSPHTLKDFYVVPLHERSSVPEVLRHMKFTAIDRKEPNCLIGVLVKSKRSPNSSAYTPTPIK